MFTNTIITNSMLCLYIQDDLGKGASGEAFKCYSKSRYHVLPTNSITLLITNSTILTG